MLTNKSSSSNGDKPDYLCHISISTKASSYARFHKRPQLWSWPRSRSSSPGLSVHPFGRVHCKRGPENATSFGWNLRPSGKSPAAQSDPPESSHSPQGLPYGLYDALGGTGGWEIDRSYGYFQLTLPLSALNGRIYIAAFFFAVFYVFLLLGPDWISCWFHHRAVSWHLLRDPHRFFMKNISGYHPLPLLPWISWSRLSNSGQGQRWFSLNGWCWWKLHKQGGFQGFDNGSIVYIGVRVVYKCARLNISFALMWRYRRPPAMQPPTYFKSFQKSMT